MCNHKIIFRNEEQVKISNPANLCVSCYIFIFLQFNKVYKQLFPMQILLVFMRFKLPPTLFMLQTSNLAVMLTFTGSFHLRYSQICGYSLFGWVGHVTHCYKMPIQPNQSVCWVTNETRPNT